MDFIRVTILKFADVVHQRRNQEQSTVITLDMVRNRKNEWLGPNFLGPLSGTPELGKQLRLELKNYVNQAEKEFKEAVNIEKGKRRAAKMAKAAETAVAEQENDDRAEKQHGKDSQQSDEESAAAFKMALMWL